MNHLVPHIPKALNAVIQRYASALALLALWSCATSIPPDGGPADAEPPAIIETEPVHGATNVASREVRFVFSEYVDRNSFQQAVHVSPLLETQPKFDWSGKEVTMEFPGDLQDDRTYVISVGTNVKDVHAGNMMKSSYTLAFSTGDTLDTGILSGKVFDETPAGISVFAYRLDALDPDTLNPATQRPDYAIQTDENGAFTLSNLAAGRYRVFAVRDKQSNYLYDSGNDAIGVFEGDINTATDSGATMLRYLITVHDTSAPYIQTIIPINARSLEIRFSEPSLPSPPAVGQIVIRDSAAGTDLIVAGVMTIPNKNSSYTVFTQDEMDDGRYILIIDSLYDATGNLSAFGKNEMAFTGAAEPDTAAPGLLNVYPAPNENNVVTDSAFTVRFTRPMSITAGIILTDSSGTEIPLDAFWTSPHELLLRHADLQPAMRYTLCLGLATFTDSLNARPIADTTYCYAFKTIDSDVHGSISGQIVLPRPAEAPVRVTARATTGVWKRTSTAVNGKYAFPKVPEGKYMMRAWVDSDTNGTYSFGKPHPFTPSERFGALSDTVRVRARWESEGADITIP